MPVSEFKLPDVGEGLTEAEIVSWLVEVGDTIKVNDIVCEIETAKSLVELPSPYAGKVSRLMVSAGETVAVGTPIIAVASGADAEAETPAPDLTPAPGAAAVEPGMVGSPAPNADNSDSPGTLVGYGPRTASGTRRARKAAPDSAQAAPIAEARPMPEPEPDPEALVEPTSAPSVVHPSEQSATASSAAKVLAKPPVRKLAKDLGVDLSTVVATGPAGTISRADVESHADGQATSSEAVSEVEVEATPYASAATARPAGGETRVPIKGVRKMTAQAMVASAFTAPHVTEWITFDATKTMRMVRRLRADKAFADVRVSPLLLVARAVCLAARRTPEVNASWDEAAQEIVLKHSVNLGIAAATPRGLVVPNIKNADAMSAPELAAAIGELTATARSGKTQPADMAGGTFTITNVGVFGVDAGTPILNPGESAILAMGAIRKQPWVVGKKVRPRWVTTLALSFDHRIVDGQQGSQFLADVAAIIEAPGRALLF